MVTIAFQQLALLARLLLIATTLVTVVTSQAYADPQPCVPTESVLPRVTVEGLADPLSASEFLAARGISFPYQVSGDQVLAAFRARCLAAGPSWTFDPYSDPARNINSHQPRAEFSDPSVPDQSNSGGQNGGTIDVFDTPEDALRAYDDLVNAVDLGTPGHWSGFVQGNILLTLSSKMPADAVDQYKAAFESLTSAEQAVDLVTTILPPTPTLRPQAAPATTTPVPATPTSPLATATPMPATATLTPVPPFKAVTISGDGETNSAAFYLPSGNYSADWSAACKERYSCFISLTLRSASGQLSSETIGDAGVMTAGDVSSGSTHVYNVKAGDYYVQASATSSKNSPWSVSITR